MYLLIGLFFVVAIAATIKFIIVPIGNSLTPKPIPISNPEVLRRHIPAGDHSSG
jgi:hypothetical protein